MLSRRVVAVVCVVVASCAVARAQSAEDGFNPGANGNVYVMMPQADGKILVGGAFTGLGGSTGTTTRNYLGRLNADGSLDTDFNPGANGDVYAFAVQPDGKILVGGTFTTLGGVTRNRIGRLNADGSLDNSFNPGADALVYALAVQPDGKILVGGQFSTLGGGTRNRIGRLNAGGSLDDGFNPGANDFVYAFALQPGGKILAVGAFTMMGGGGPGQTLRNRIARLNADGSLDPNFNPGAEDWVTAVAVQPDGRILVGGNFNLLCCNAFGLTTVRRRIARLNPDGSVDSTFNPGTDGFVVTISVQADGKILVGGGFTKLGGGGTGTIPRRNLGRLETDGSVDMSFNIGADNYVYATPVQPDGSILIGGNYATLFQDGRGPAVIFRIARVTRASIDGTFHGNANGTVYAMALQPDGEILVGGSFISLSGGLHFRLGRFHSDGDHDDYFDADVDDIVWTLAVQPDGKILVGGEFTFINSLGRSRIGRLNADGSLDNAFDPGANGDVLALALQADGKILVGGLFTTLGGGSTGLNPRDNFGRLNADGSLDNGFNPGANDDVVAMAVQPDGKILVGGNFTALGNGATTPRQHIARLNPDGSLDTAFDPGANGTVETIVVLPDGKILVAGYFTMLGGGGTGTTPRNRIGRLNADGTLDTTFAAGADNGIEALVVQADGKILVAGLFTALSDVATGFNTRNRIGRFTAAGALDTSFNPGANQDVYALAVQADGKIVAGGNFTMLGGGGTGVSARTRIGRLTNTGAASQSLSASGGGVTWLRSGAGPDVSRVTFESSADGVTYTPLGSGARVAGGWQLPGLGLPAKQNLYLRARGFYGTGIFNGSGSIVESIALKTYQLFSDDPLTAGASPIRAVHILELRTRMDVQRVRFGLGAFAWTDASLTAGMTAAAAHINELRTALQQAYTAAGQPVPTFTESPLVPGSTSIKAVHLHQLRDAVIVLEAR